MDTGDKASNKAMSSAMKYALCQIFCIPTANMPDPDGESFVPTTVENNRIELLEIVKQKIAENKLNVYKIMSYFGVNSLEGLTESQMGQFLKML